jgi:hypothetical protein
VAAVLVKAFELLANERVIVNNKNMWGDCGRLASF